MRLPKRNLEDAAAEQRALDAYSRLYGADSTLLSKDTPEALLLKQWLKAKLASRESYVKAINSKGLNESNRINYTHWYEKQAFELGKEFK